MSSVHSSTHNSLRLKPLVSTLYQSVPQSGGSNLFLWLVRNGTLPLQTTLLRYCVSCSLFWPSVRETRAYVHCHHFRLKNKYFELKTRGAPMGRPKLELLASNGVATFVMPFSITLDARHTHIKQTHTCIHRHTHRHTHTYHTDTNMHTHTNTHTHHTDTHRQTDTHTQTHVVCMCVHVCAHGNPQNHT